MAVTGGGATQAPGDLAGLVVGTWPQWVPTFRLVHQLGNRGAEGTTYRAERLRREGEEFVASGELVALKVFDRDAFWRDKDATSRPLHERLHDLEDLAHLLNEVPGVVRFRSPFIGPSPVPPGVVPEPDNPRLRTYLPMELVEGATLEQAIASLPEPEARHALLARLDSLAATLQGLATVRPDAPIAHRDVKPANLVLTGLDGLTLVDLGLLISPRRSVTAGVGSFGFMAPEQQEAARLDPASAHRVDWFGFYATAACVLTGEEPPWSVQGWPAWLAGHQEVTPRARELLLAAATARPERRPAPGAWLASLEEAVRDRRRVPLGRVVRRHRRALAIATSLVVAAVAVSGLTVALSPPNAPAARKPKVITVRPNVTAELHDARGRRTTAIAAGDQVALDVSISNGGFVEMLKPMQVQVTMRPTLTNQWRIDVVMEGDETPRLKRTITLLSRTSVLLDGVEERPSTLTYSQGISALDPSFRPPAADRIEPLSAVSATAISVGPLAADGAEPAVRGSVSLHWPIQVRALPTAIMSVAAGATALPGASQEALDRGCRLPFARTGALRQFGLWVWTSNQCWEHTAALPGSGKRLQLLLVLTNATGKRLNGDFVRLQLPKNLKMVEVLRRSEPSGDHPAEPFEKFGSINLDKALDATLKPGEAVGMPGDSLQLLLTLEARDAPCPSSATGPTVRDRSEGDVQNAVWLVPSLTCD